MRRLRGKGCPVEPVPPPGFGDDPLSRRLRFAAAVERAERRVLDTAKRFRSGSVVSIAMTYDLAESVDALLAVEASIERGASGPAGRPEGAR